MKYHTGCMITNVDKVLSTDDEKKPEILIDDGRVHAAQQEIVMEVENGISRVVLIICWDNFIHIGQGKRKQRCFLSSRTNRQLFDSLNKNTLDINVMCGQTIRIKNFIPTSLGLLYNIQLLFVSVYGKSWHANTMMIITSRHHALKLLFCSCVLSNVYDSGMVSIFKQFLGRTSSIVSNNRTMSS